MADLMCDGERRTEADVFVDAAAPLGLAHSSHRGQAWTKTHGRQTYKHTVVKLGFHTCDRDVTADGGSCGFTWGGWVRIAG